MRRALGLLLSEGLGKGTSTRPKVGAGEGRPEPEPKKLRESEGCIGAVTLGNSWHLDPVEQRQSVSRVNFRRET